MDSGTKAIIESLREVAEQLTEEPDSVEKQIRVKFLVRITDTIITKTTNQMLMKRLGVH